MSEKILHYEIAEKIGAGGMGEVYRARDTKLNRDVALKILPEDFGKDPERVARFAREAHVLAAINHPNIAAIHDIHSDQSKQFLVLELITGHDLGELIKKGPVPVSEATAIARQIADAMETAHAEGVVHRDLKPANVMLSPEGRVKVLDFGLATAIQGDSGEASSSDLSQSPTAMMSSPTIAGVILGTAAYMSPEQARGKVVDKRSDIWAFGCVLYEMLTGKLAFAGETVSDTISLILQREPDWDALPANTPPRIRRLLRRCLEKDKRKRLRDIGDAMIELDDSDEDTIASRQAQGQVQSGGVSGYVWLIVGAVIGAAIAVTALYPRLAGPEEPEISMHFDLSLPADITPSTVSIKISDDGRTVAFTGVKDNETAIYIHDIETGVTRKVDGTERGASPSFSPDGKWLTFGRGSKIYKTAVDGGSPVELTDAYWNPDLDWGPGGNLYFTKTLTSGISSVSSSGGEVTTLTRPDSTQNELGHWWPHALPDGRHVMFTAWRSRTEDGSIRILDLETGQTTNLLDGGVHPMYSDGYLFYTAGTSVVAAPFDLERLEITGPRIPVLNNVSVATSDGKTGALPVEGALVYGDDSYRKARLMWVEPGRAPYPIVERIADYDVVRISPDGSRIVVATDERANLDISVIDAERGTITPVTTTGTNNSPIWSSDGEFIIFASMRRGPFELYQVPADGSATEQLIFASKSDISPVATVSGDQYVARMAGTSSSNDLWIFQPSAAEPMRPIIASPAEDVFGTISSQGDLVAYVSNPGGQYQVFVQSLASGGRRYQVSIDGGIGPVWASDGNTLYFYHDNNIMKVTITRKPNLSASSPEVFITSDHIGGRMEYWDLMPNTERFAMIVNQPAGTPLPIHVILNWKSEFAKKFGQDQ